jgi:16S rRNA G527 N7-methylase RsmG
MKILMESIEPIIGQEADLESILTYLEILLDYNRGVNLISRSITAEGIVQLLSETVLLDRYISCDTIVDAGSGNGILGIPAALMKKNEHKTIILVEPGKKKFLFLMNLKEQMKLPNVEVKGVSIEEYLKNTKKETRSLVARGFPGFSVFFRYLKKGLVTEVVVITSQNKIKKNQIHLESIRKKIYNVPLRKNLKILKLF